MMQVGDREFTMAAKALIELFGNQAAEKADERAQEYRQAGETEGEQFWTRLSTKIRELLAQD